MMRFFYISIFLLILCSCSESNDNRTLPADDLSLHDDSIQEPWIKAYSCDITSEGVEVTYKTSYPVTAEALYKDQNSQKWDSVEVKIENGFAVVKLTNLTLHHYYNILINVYNGKGKSATDNFIVQYEYDSKNITYFRQPFSEWNTSISNLKTVMNNNGNIIDEETEYDGGYKISYRFKYKELKTEYVFNNDKFLKEILVYFDSNKVVIDEIRRFISQALGYLSYGNIHVNINNLENIYPLYKTTEGASYVIVYPKDQFIIVNYLCAYDIIVSDILYK